MYALIWQIDNFDGFLILWDFSLINFEIINFVKALPCTLNPYTCNSHGTCSNNYLGGYTCSCNTGYTGVNCQYGMRIPSFFRKASCS